jgi:hypothetical protein
MSHSLNFKQWVNSTALALLIGGIAACGAGDGKTTAPAGGSGTPGQVTDLSVSASTDTTATVSFTQVDDGTGHPAQYDLRYTVAPISWGSAADTSHGSCSNPIAGTAIGVKLTCTIAGLAPSTSYNFQIMAFRGTLNAGAVLGALSAIVAAATPGSGVVSPPATNVFFQENFDDTNLAARGWYDNTSIAITTADYYGASGGSVLYHFTPGATTPANGGSIRHKFGPSNSMYVSYYIKYSSNWVGSAHTYQPHEFYALSSLDGDWDGLSNDWMTLYIEHNYQNGGEPVMAMQDNKAINTLLGALPINLIAITENRSTGGCNGVSEANMLISCFILPPWYNSKELVGPVVFQSNPGTGYKGNWNHVEAYFQLNSIVNGIGQADGVMQYWFNGTLIMDRHDILFRTGARATLQISQFVIAPYIGDGSPVDQSMWVDSLTVAAARGTTP